MYPKQQSYCHVCYAVLCHALLCCAVLCWLLDIASYLCQGDIDVNTEYDIARYRSTEGVVRVLVERLVEQKKLVPASKAMCRISVGPQPLP